MTNLEVIKKLQESDIEIRVKFNDTQYKFIHPKTIVVSANVITTKKSVNSRGERVISKTARKYQRIDTVPNIFFDAKDDASLFMDKIIIGIVSDAFSNIAVKIIEDVKNGEIIIDNDD